MNKKRIRLFCIACREVFERHFGNNIKKWIKDAIEEFEIFDGQILAISIDSASNVTKAVDELIAEMYGEPEDDNDEEETYAGEIPTSVADGFENDEEFSIPITASPGEHDPVTGRVHRTAHRSPTSAGCQCNADLQPKLQKRPFLCSSIDGYASNAEHSDFGLGERI